VLPCALRLAGLAPEARRLDREPHLFPLAPALPERGRAGGRGKPRPPFLFVAAMFYPRPWPPSSSPCVSPTLPRSRPRLLEGLPACSAARTCSRFARCRFNGRRADLMAIDPKGELTIVEIKVAKADLVGDGKWTDYLDYCDRFFWAVP